MNTRACLSCGALVPAVSAYCPSCGVPLGAGPPTVLLPPGPPETRRLGGREVIVGALVALLVVALVALVAVVMTSSGSTHRAASPGPSSAASATILTTTTTTQPTTTTQNPLVVLQQAHDAQMHDLVKQLEPILQQSSVGREQIKRLITGVQNGCQTAPEDASVQIDSIASNRQSVLVQLSAMSTSGNSDAADLVAKLHAALALSIEADNDYAQWLKADYSNFYYTTPVGCPNGEAPTNAQFDAGQAASSSASAAKQTFTGAFNTWAGRFGEQTWSPSDF